jgi:hypothetical protein
MEFYRSFDIKKVNPTYAFVEYRSLLKDRRSNINIDFFHENKYRTYQISFANYLNIN